MTNNTIPNVPRELLERTIDRLQYGHEHDKALRELRDILATSKSAADDERMRFDLWIEQHGWSKDHTMLHELWLAWKAGSILSATSPTDHVEDVRAMVADPSPAGVDGLVAVKVWEADADWDDHELVVRLSAAQAIIDGLRGEVAKINSDRLACWAEFKVMTRACLDAEKERDQQAQRIGEMEGLLRHAQKQVPTGSGLHMRIDAALSAGKEGE